MVGQHIIGGKRRVDTRRRRAFVLPRGPKTQVLEDLIRRAQDDLARVAISCAGSDSDAVGAVAPAAARRARTRFEYQPT